jgi:two-component system response regulator RegA
LTGRRAAFIVSGMEPAARKVDRVLLVEDEAALRQTLERALAARFAEVRSAASVREAAELLASFEPDLLLLDVELGDGTALDVMRAALARETVPLVVAMSGAATPVESFDLAQLGVRSFLPKPLDLRRLDAALDAAIASAPDLRAQVRAAVGQRPIHELEEEVRVTMLREALARAKGSRRGAAKLLAVSRQVIQHMLRRHEP